METINLVKIEQLVIEAFEQVLYREPGDAYEHTGQIALREVVRKAARAQRPIEFLLPGFAHKNPNLDKVLGPLPDLGETLALQKLATLASTIASTYPPGCRVIIFSDGRIWGDATVHAYQQGLRAIEALDPYVLFHSLDDHLPALSGEGAIQERLESGWGRRPDLSDRDKYRVYRRFIDLVREDHPWPPDIDDVSLRAICESSALRMMVRHSALTALLEATYPDHVRLSVHPSSNAGKKFSVKFFEHGETCALPYHNALLMDKEGQHPTPMHRSQAEALGAVVSKHNGQPWCLVWPS